MANTPVVDPWLEADNFGAPLVDFAVRPEDMIDPDEPMHLDAHPSLSPEIVIAEGGVIRQPEAAPIVESEPEAPEVIEIGDGASITLEKDKGWWVASLDPGNGANSEVFKGKNKNELVANVLKGKLNATKKIRELNLKVKMGGVPQQPRTAPQAMPQARDLTADEIFEIKSQLESNPGLAFDTLFQKQYGVSMAALVQLAQKGANADANLGTEAVAKEFLSNNPEYYPVTKNEGLLIQWLAKYKLGKPGADVGELYAGGAWTVENLEEAFQDLSSDNLLQKAPRQPNPTPPVAVLHNEPAPAPRPDERIVRTETRPRAGLGIQRMDVTPVPPPEAPRPPSVEDLESMSDSDIANTLNAIRRQPALSRRS